jgi:hypothetical protein
MLNEFFILFSYAFLGAGVKYADQAYDLEVFSKTKANILAVPGAALMAYLVVFDSSSATIFFSILLVVALSRKIDNLAFYIGTGILLFLPVVFHDVLLIEWLPFGALVFSGILDELGSDWADRRRRNRRFGDMRGGLDDSLLRNFGERFFLHRFAMKIAVLALSAAGFFQYLYFLAFLLFDLMYLLVEQYSFSIERCSLSKAGPSLEG